MIDLGSKAERFEDHYPASEGDLLAGGCVAPPKVDEEIPAPVQEQPVVDPVAAEQTQTVAEVAQPLQLAQTGGVDFTPLAALGGIALVVIGLWVLADQIIKAIGRK